MITAIIKLVLAIFFTISGIAITIKAKSISIKLRNFIKTQGKIVSIRPTNIKQCILTIEFIIANQILKTECPYAYIRKQKPHTGQMLTIYVDPNNPRRIFPKVTNDKLYTIGITMIICGALGISSSIDDINHEQIESKFHQSTYNKYLE